MAKFIKGDATKEVDAKFTGELLAQGWEFVDESKSAEPKAKAKKTKDKVEE